MPLSRLKSDIGACPGTIKANGKEVVILSIVFIK